MQRQRTHRPTDRGVLSLALLLLAPINALTFVSQIPGYFNTIQQTTQQTIERQTSAVPAASSATRP
jgi:hypothetical protein